MCVCVQRSTAKEPDVAEFISALAAGNNAQLMVVACATSPEECGSNNIILALEAAAQQTGGEVVCIHPNTTTCSTGRQYVKFVTGDAETLVMNEYKEADCILIDCKLENCEAILETVGRVVNIKRRSRNNNNNTTVVGFNAGRRRMGSSWSCQGLKNAHFLPIGEGLLVTKMDKNSSKDNNNSSFAVLGKKNKWLTKIDKYTGEEHVFRV